MFAEGERLSAAGRHAAAERSLRAAAAAFDRRGNAIDAGRAELALGKLLLTRGRAPDAVKSFERAHDRFQRAQTPILAISATAYLGIAQTDLMLLSEAERSCRAAYAAAAAVRNADTTAAAGVCLARVLFWQERYGEARDLLESFAPPDVEDVTARYWCLIARLRLLANGFREAREALRRARLSAHHADPAVDAHVRRWEAVFQARVGDLQAVELHVRAGLAAARAAHVPLSAIRLRLTLVEGLIDAGRKNHAKSVATRFAAIPGACLPPLVKTQIQRVLERCDAADAGKDQRPAAASAREAVVHFFSNAGSNVDDLEALRELLSASQREDEREALGRAAAVVRVYTNALGVGIYGCVDGEPRLLASAGKTLATIATRSCGAGISIGPEQTPDGCEAAVPMRYLGRLIGALSLRWGIDGPAHAGRSVAFSAAAAAACAPVVYVLLEQQSGPASTEGEPDLVGVSHAIEEVRNAVRRAANAPFTVLIEGESGSGKELVAKAIHRSGSRRERHFCAFNCAAMPEDLVDAELFGHARGAFTGAAAERLGLFESAEGGTVFLDEVGELSSRAQAKILRALQEGEVRRVGENFTRAFDARLVAATNRSLRAEVEAGRFRQDLFYRLDVIRIVVPPLRERVEDIPLLAARFWRASAERIGSKAVLSQTAVAALTRYDWPGNVRELQNVLTALVVAAPRRGVVGASDMPAAIARAAPLAMHESLESARLKFEERFVRAALARAAGHRGRAASAVGLSRQGFAKLLHRLKLDV